MRLQILTVGRMKAGPEQELYARFADRLAKAGKPLHLAGPELAEIPESRQARASERKREETEKLLSKLEPGARLVVLDERGKDLSSRQLAELVRNEQDNGAGALAFAIGGPDGHGSDMLTAAHHRIRFGALTWPHQLVRVMLAEQLYRAVTIASGHPYHRE